MNLSKWLDVIQSGHIVDMDLSLERVKEVASRLKLLRTSASVIIVGGTNGKGSCVAALEGIYKSAGYLVGAFTSPVLFKHNEYVRIAGNEVSDDEFCLSYARIEAHRGDITLTAFEYTALAAFDIFKRLDLDIWILEVGLGGRFDAVNIFNADVSIVTSIGIDHIDWLGDTREKIAYEKAGIFRASKPAICGDLNPPDSLTAVANQINAKFLCQGKQFGFQKAEASWSFWGPQLFVEHLPIPNLNLANMSCALMAIELLQEKNPVKAEAIVNGLNSINLPGRIQVVEGPVTRVYDVAHNPDAAKLLSAWLKNNPSKGKDRAIFSMLNDKDIVGTINELQGDIDEWFIASLDVKRAASLDQLILAFKKVKLTFWQSYTNLVEAYRAALKLSEPGDRIICFGSFHTVKELLNLDFKTSV